MSLGIQSCKQRSEILILSNSYCFQDQNSLAFNYFWICILVLMFILQVILEETSETYNKLIFKCNRPENMKSSNISSS